MNRLKEIRESRGLTQQELAEVSKVSLRSISRIEASDANFTQKTAEKLALALNCTPGEILGKDELKQNVSKEEEFILNTFRSVDDATKDEIMRYIRYQKYCARESKKHVG